MSTVNSLWRMREVGSAQSDLLTQIHAEAFANYWNPSDFNDFFAVAGTHALLAESNGQPAGLVVLRVVGTQADIITIATRPPFRRQGLARSMMLQATQMAQQLGATDMFLDVEDGNTAAYELYNSLGFQQLSRRKLYYRQKNGSYTDALVMTRKLD